jgi:hypothetical protein
MLLGLYFPRKEVYSVLCRPLAAFFQLYVNHERTDRLCEL